MLNLLLISAAQLGKLRLVRLLVEGGAQVNERNQRGETPLRGNQSGSSMLRLIQYLLRNQADPSIQDKTVPRGSDVHLHGAGRAGRGGSDPCMEDYPGASALVYAINARDQDTLTVLLHACRARGRDIIIIKHVTGSSSSAGPQTHAVRLRHSLTPGSPCFEVPSAPGASQQASQLPRGEQKEGKRAVASSRCFHEERVQRSDPSLSSCKTGRSRSVTRSSSDRREARRRSICREMSSNKTETMKYH
uniref:Uncharacterized protein n=1 Tax=Sinocyclocheilus anshuiensis TaxID=1608454 RepID=A0A671MP79_9TELE